MSSNLQTQPLILTKDILLNYKYIKHILSYTLRIRDLLCRELERLPLHMKVTNYVFNMDDPHNTLYNDASYLLQNDYSKNRVLDDVVNQLHQYFPDSKITIHDKEDRNGFIITKNTYIEIDWS